MYTNRRQRTQIKSKRKFAWRDLLVPVCTAATFVGVALIIALPLKAVLPEYETQENELSTQEGTASNTMETRSIPHDMTASHLTFYAFDDLTIAQISSTGIELPEEDTTADGIVYTATRLGVEVREYDSTIDYSSVISMLYETIDPESETAEYMLALCEVYELQRNLKIEYTGADESLKTNTFSAEHSMEEIEAIMHPHVPYMQYTEQDVEELAALIYAEAGSSYMTDYHKQCVGSVVLCRLADYETWGDSTIHEVIWHPGQYPATRSKTYYDERCYNIALDLLENGPVVYAIWQANFPQGENVEYFEYPGLCKPTWIDK